MSISFTQGGGEVRLTFAPNVRYMPYGKGFILRGHSIEEADGARYLRLYGTTVSSSGSSSRKAISSRRSRTRSSRSLSSTSRTRSSPDESAPGALLHWE